MRLSFTRHKSNDTSAFQSFCRVSLRLFLRVSTALFSANSRVNFSFSPARLYFWQIRAPVARKAHNLEVAGSIPASATTWEFLIMDLLKAEVPRQQSGYFCYISKLKNSLPAWGEGTPKM